MSDAVSVLNGASSEGLNKVSDAGLKGLSNTALKNAATGVAGVDFPGQGECNCVGERGIAWMSPDELLVMAPHVEVATDLERMQKTLSGVHHLLADVSDARAIFQLEGDEIRATLAKLTPADLRKNHFKPGHLRRTHVSQVPAAFWFRDDTHLDLICFRSVQDYMWDLLCNAAQ